MTKRQRVVQDQCWRARTPRATALPLATALSQEPPLQWIGHAVTIAQAGSELPR